MSKKFDLRSLEYNQFTNPLVEPTTIKLKNRVARTAAKERSLYDPETGEITAVAAIHTVDVKDDAQFVKVFADGVKAAFGLNRTAARVFQSVLTMYQAEKMTGGFADCVTLRWFDDGLNGDSIGMSDQTFNNGLKTLLENKFLYPKTPNVYWVNPALFFKGDRVAFIREYRRKSPTEITTIDGDTTSLSLPLE